MGASPKEIQRPFSWLSRRGRGRFILTSRPQRPKRFAGRIDSCIHCRRSHPGRTNAGICAIGGGRWWIARQSAQGVRSLTKWAGDHRRPTGSGPANATTKNERARDESVKPVHPVVGLHPMTGRWRRHDDFRRQRRHPIVDSLLHTTSITYHAFVRCTG
jgi:hypothetical protein